MQLDANDPLRGFREEFLIPTRTGSGMGLSPHDPVNILIGSFK